MCSIMFRSSMVEGMYNDAGFIPHTHTQTLVMVNNGEINQFPSLKLHIKLNNIVEPSLRTPQNCFTKHF